MLRACSSRPSLLLLAGAASLHVLKKHEAHVISRCDDDRKISTKSSKLDDCLNPACHSTMDLLKKFNLKKKLSPKVIQETKKETNSYNTGCPVDRDQLGRGTWDLIHTVAATYPEHPSKEEQQHIEMFLRSLSMVYPCPYCATHFQKKIAESPPRCMLYLSTKQQTFCFAIYIYIPLNLSYVFFFDILILLFTCSVESREALMRWCCSFHNEVNAMLGKPEFICTTDELDVRWKDGRDECWEEKRISDSNSNSSGGS